MTSFEINIKLKDTLSPTVADIVGLAKEKKFSNIESIEYVETKRGYTYYRLYVNNRTLNKKSDFEIIS